MEMDFYPFHIKPLTKLLIDWDKPWTSFEKYI